MYLTKEHTFPRTFELAPVLKREKRYYCLIQNLNQLLSSQTKYEGKSITVLIVFISLDGNSCLKTTNRSVVSMNLREQSYQMLSSLKISSSESPSSFTLLLRAWTPRLSAPHQIQHTQRQNFRNINRAVSVSRVSLQKNQNSVSLLFSIMENTKWIISCKLTRRRAKNLYFHERDWFNAINPFQRAIVSTSHSLSHL